MALGTDPEVRRWVYAVTGPVIGVVVALLLYSRLYLDADPQVAASALSVILSAVLTATTVLYLLATLRLANESKRTNDMAAQNIERSLRINAPTLRQIPGDRGFDETTAMWRFTYMLYNEGTNTAHGVELHTTHGVAELPVLAHEQGGIRVALEVPADAYEPTSSPPAHPALMQFTFLDAGGTRWRQTGLLPELDVA